MGRAIGKFLCSAPKGRNLISLGWGAKRGVPGSIPLILESSRDGTFDQEFVSSLSAFAFFGFSKVKLFIFAEKLLADQLFLNNAPQAAAKHLTPTFAEYEITTQGSLLKLFSSHRSGKRPGESSCERLMMKQSHDDGVQLHAWYSKFLPADFP